MDEILELTKINYVSLFVSIFIILFGIKAVASIFEWLIDKLGLETKWTRRRNQDHELIAETTKEFNEFREDMKKYGAYYNEMKMDIDKYSDLSKKIDSCMTGIRKSVDELKENNCKEDSQIAALQIGMIELLGSEFDRRFTSFVALGGVPENELSTFTAVFKAYEQLGGNHRRKEKYDYATQKMRLIPVETHLVDEHEAKNKL